MGLAGEAAANRNVRRHGGIFSLQKLRRSVRIGVPARKTVRPAVQGGPSRLAKLAVSRCCLAAFASRWLPMACAAAFRA